MRDEMVKTQLQDSRYLAVALEVPRFAKIAKAGMMHVKGWNWGLGGMLATEDIAGRATKWSMFWGGRPNLQWWIDSEDGTGGLYASQLLPSSDEQSAEFFKDLQRAVFGRDRTI